MSCERVSRWFAMGFRLGEDGKPENALPLSVCENDWQRVDMKAGYAEGARGMSHVQFWLVSGDWKHEDVEMKIVTTENTEHTEGEK
jgi:hypothetical protein